MHLSSFRIVLNYFQFQPEGKIIAEDLNRYVSSHPSDKFDMVASSLSISQATECGTIYTEKEIDRIFKIAKQKI